MLRRWVVSPGYRSAIDAIQAARLAQGVTQRGLAQRLGKPPSFVNKIENLERRLDILEFIAIAQALGMEPGALLGKVMEALPEKVEL